MGRPTLQGKKERRREARYSCGGCYCPVSALAEKKSWEAVVLDLSSRGIRLLLDDEVSSGSLLRAQLFSQAWRRWHIKTMRVVHAQPHESGWWLIGCSFAQPLAAEEFTEMIA
jgi:hypothetical protein